jgi:hypothetical protein
MAFRKRIASVLFLYNLLLLTGGCGAAPELAVSHSPNSETIPLYEVFEITYKHDGEYENPFFDVTVEVRFTSPSAKTFEVGGFHYGSEGWPEIRVLEERGEERTVEYLHDRQDTWKTRFAPSEAGRWRYSYTFTNLRGERATGEGSFVCLEGGPRSSGFVRIHPTNPFRFVFEDGSPYFPIGLQDCWGDWTGSGAVADKTSMEGPFRLDRDDPLPPGPLFVRGPSNNPQNADVYFRFFSKAGFNLYRFSQKNCSLALYRDLDHYNVHEAIMVDELLQLTRLYGLRIFYGLFGFEPAYNQQPNDRKGMEKVKRFVKYSVDRWGAYVDFWEFLNEQRADRRWYEIMIEYLRSIDPYNHPITTSWERPELAGIDINAPHWYERERETESDLLTRAKADQWKRRGKPVVVGEQGNYTNRNLPREPGVGGVWDSGSARRMRLRIWTAFFKEISFIFWNTSYARDGHFMNIWLGPEERSYVRALQDFSYRLDIDSVQFKPELSDPDEARAYGLASSDKIGLYLHHFTNHSEPLRGLKVILDVPETATGYWYDPKTAAVLETFETPSGKRIFEAPDFTIDMALLITPAGPPDIDGDGLANHLDGDNDNDGWEDTKDAFPLDPEEWLDADGDLIGDNMDADDNGDGVGDDENGNGIPDHEELDFDGDGVDRSKAVPWDVFPLDATEWEDTDGDGTGNNADTDDDGDGFSDSQEETAGTDPLSPLSFPDSDF